MFRSDLPLGKDLLLVKVRKNLKRMIEHHSEEALVETFWFTGDAKRKFHLFGATELLSERHRQYSAMASSAGICTTPTIPLVQHSELAGATPAALEVSRNLCSSCLLVRQRLTQRPDFTPPQCYMLRTASVVRKLGCYADRAN